MVRILCRMSWGRNVFVVVFMVVLYAAETNKIKVKGYFVLPRCITHILTDFIVTLSRD